MKCTQCSGRSQLPLCKRCTDTLDVMLRDLCWLLGELEVTAARQDRLAVPKWGTPEHPCGEFHMPPEQLAPIPCAWSGLSLTGGDLPNDRVFGACCECGAAVTVVDGRIPVHYPGVDERPA